MIKINVHPYPNRVWFTVDHDKFMEKRGATFGLFDDCFADGCVTVSECRRDQLIGVFNVTHNVIAHEVGHSVIELFQYVGMPVNLDTQEAFCYLTGSINKQIYDYLKKIKVDVK